MPRRSRSVAPSASPASRLGARARPRDASGAAEPVAIRLAPAVRADAELAAARAGKPWRTWAAEAIRDAAATAGERPRFASLEDVLRYVGEAPAGGPVRERLIAELTPVLLADWTLLRGAIAAAWAAGRGGEIAAAIEAHASAREPR